MIDFEKALVTLADARIRHDKCQMLAEFPEMGRERHELIVNLRSFTVRNYIIFYQPVADGIEVLRVLYGARDLYRAFDEMIGEPNPEDS